MLRNLLPALVLLCSSLLCRSLAAQQISGPLTNQRIIDLSHSGVRSDELLRIVATAPSVNFDLSPAAEQAMISAGVSEETIRAMAAREQGSPAGRPLEQQPTPAYQPRPNRSPGAGTVGDYVPHLQLFFGGTYFRVHASGLEAPQIVGLPDYVLGQHNLNFPLYGWDLTFTENMNRWFGVDADVAGAYGAPKPYFLCSASSLTDMATCLTPYPDHAPVQTKLHTFMLGPRFSFHRYGRIVPFAHVLLGVAHINGTLDHTAIVPSLGILLPQGFSLSNTALVVAPGAGVDFMLTQLISIRLLQVDYMMTRFYSERQDNARVSVGVSFQFGNR